VELLASATDIIKTTYIQPITTRYTAFLADRGNHVSLLEAATQILGKTRKFFPTVGMISRTQKHRRPA